MAGGGVGGALARGVESGLAIDASFRDREARQQERDRDYNMRVEENSDRRARADKQEARQKVVDERADVEFGDKVADDVHKTAITDFAATVAQYGGWESVPPDVQARLKKTAAEAGGIQEQARKRRTELAFGKQKQELSDLVSNLQAGKITMEQVPDDKFYMVMAQATGRDPSDFVAGADGAPARITQGTNDLLTGLETGNEGMLLRGANTVFSPELRVGVGSEGAHGGKIIGKEIIKIIPHPNNPDLVSPVVRVYVDKPGGVKGENGATGYYDAPLTQNRSSDPNDPVKWIDMTGALDRVGQMGVLASSLNHPEARAKFDKGRAASEAQVKDYLDMYFSLGSAAAPKKTVTTTNTALPADGGETIRETRDAQGRVISSERIPHKPKTFRPASGGSSGARGALQLRLDALDEDLENGDITKEDYQEQRREILTNKSKGGAGGGKIVEAETKGIISSATKTLAAEQGLKYNETTKRWDTMDGKPAGEKQLTDLNAKISKASQVVRDNAAAGKKTTLTDALTAARGAGADKPASSKYEVGKTYKDAQGRMATYQADGTWKVK
jgi:hypothetical protein